MHSMVISFVLFLFVYGCGPKLFSPVISSDGVRYFYQDPTAVSVAVAGSFNQWNAAMNQLTGPDASGKWTILLPLQPGRYEYRFVINATKWVLDPSAPSIDDGMGGKNSIVDVPN